LSDSDNRSIHRLTTLPPSSGSISLNGRICHTTLTCDQTNDGKNSFTLDLVPIESLVAFVTIDDEAPTDEEVINDEIFVYEHQPHLRISKIRPFTPDGLSVCLSG
jgi:hypothetical protein